MKDYYTLIEILITLNKNNKELKNFENQQQITLQKYVDTQTNQYSDLSKFYANL